LAGVPIGIKDLIATEGITTSAGSAAYRSFVPDEDDVVVERIRAAGAVRIGKTNVPEFGYSGVGHNPILPTTRNPWNPDLTPGGSSAGSGAAVAARMGPVALGSDGGGSVRIPAAHCGVVGMKPSMGRVPLYPGCRDERYPGLSSWESLEHLGPLSRTVADTALLLSVMAGPDRRDRHSIPTGDIDWIQAAAEPAAQMRVAYSADLGYVKVDPQVRSLVDAAVTTLERDLGWKVEAADPGWDDPFDAFWGTVAADSDLVGMRAQAHAHQGMTTPHLAAFLDRPWTAEDLTQASVIRKSVANRLWRFMDDYDLLVTPTLTVPPFPVHMQGPERVDDAMVDQFAWLSFTLPFNLTGNPAISIPAGWTDDGRPVGLQIVGRHLADASVLSAAAAYEQAAGWSERVPHMISALVS
jgi:aspartyl-tRNA(Asn)/glutamyl-tRNA(Gln) amidotransferase subunit A